jgi:hypothetical protein
MKANPPSYGLPWASVSAFWLSAGCTTGPPEGFRKKLTSASKVTGLASRRLSQNFGGPCP